MVDGENGPEPPAWAARKLLRQARSGMLATAMGGQPFASLVTPATAPDLSVLLLLSSLSEHTRHLRAEPRCAVMVQGEPEGPNPQTAPRVTVTGIAEPVEDEALRRRWVALHPYAEFYSGFGDFALWRIEAAAALFVGGFARAKRLRRADLQPDPDAVAAVSAAEASVTMHCNKDHPDALAAIAGTAGEWRMVATDVDGCDLRAVETAEPGQESRILRIHWAAPVQDAGGIRSELIRLAKEARNRRG